MENDYRAAVALLRQGEAPGNRAMLSEITVGINDFMTFLETRYLTEYIAQGGSKIKFVTGKAGAGKTHFLQLLSARAMQQAFVTAHINAQTCWLHDFKEVYAEIFRQVDILSFLSQCTRKIITELGYTDTEIPEGMTFADYLSSIGEFDALIKKEIRNQLRLFFMKNPYIDNNFAIACSLLTGGLLGHPTLESANRDLLLAWMAGSREIKIQALRPLGLSPSKITKYNARHMLRSLIEVVRLADYPGLVVTVDNMEILSVSTPMAAIRYTKLKRDDAYESIRELIDEIDTLRHVLFCFAFDRRLMDDELNGLKSYQALWLRIQNEIVSDRFNAFTDIIDLDKIGHQVYTAEALMEMSQKLTAVIQRLYENAYPIDCETAEQLVADAPYAGTALPRQVCMATWDGFLNSERGDGQ